MLQPTESTTKDNNSHNSTDPESKQELPSNEDDDTKTQLISAAKYKAKLLLSRKSKQQSSNTIPSKNRNLFKVKLWKSVALSSWDGCNCCNFCPICKYSLFTCCIDCSARHPADVGDCQAAWGTCCHVFHMHCILKWLKFHPVCPLCNNHWQFQTH
ncbi:hypothetical protein C9374_008707 [Naegleria lovaniensis]|uniref:RING-type domain-containing protein n=1 Tax=Naegleria lovaniensis TaxID=51637 RepID=A0AA88KFU3_NAELO|nr:uncharacterized protein C9374_008707 [Naegleria lovaniensis]KAG2378085.1 hypothetical protein C9374_008707 [Naegleria lovaniensis]